MTISDDPSGSTKQAMKAYAEALELYAKVAEGVTLPALTSTSEKARTFYLKWFELRTLLEQQIRRRDEILFSGSTETQATPSTAKPVAEGVLRARIAELEQKMVEAESALRTQRSRLIEERRAAATANRINDQLQMRLDSQIDIINERARANDVALAALAAKDQGRLLTFEMLQGIVVEVSDADIVVRFDTGDDVVEQNYDLDQFKLGKTPAVGDQISVYVYVALLAPSSADPAGEDKGETHEPRPRRNVITGDHRF